MKVTKVEIETSRPVEFAEIAQFLRYEYGLETVEGECEEKFELSLSGKSKIVWTCPVLFEYGGPGKV